jgi:pteridine reductase
MARTDTQARGAQTALVTGGARRLGRALALALADEGFDVVVHCRSSQAEARAVAAECEAKGVRAHVVRADLADRGQAEELVARAVAAAGPLDVLVNNASIFPKDTLADVTAESFIANLQVNAVAPFLIARAFARQGREGVILNMLDTRILHYDALHAAYHVSKRALFTLTRMMALEFAPKIRVNAVAPGLILPPPGEDESFLEKYASKNPLGKWGSAEDVVAAALFLIRSSFVTGQVLYVDGGFHMKGSVYGA